MRNLPRHPPRLLQPSCRARGGPGPVLFLVSRYDSRDLPKTLNAQGYPVYSGPYWWFAEPKFILPLYLTLVVSALAVARFAMGGAWLALAGGLVAGYLVWTLFEYILHRWMLHNRATRFMKKVFWEMLHKEHHLLRTMEDMDHHGIHPLISMPIVLGVVALSALGGAVGLAMGAGWALGYFAYEGLHWVFHGKPGKGLLRLRHINWLKDMHEVHHLVDARRNYGFVTMFWDRVFGTYQKLPATRVSRVEDAQHVPGIADS